MVARPPTKGGEEGVLEGRDATDEVWGETEMNVPQAKCGRSKQVDDEEAR